MPIRLPEWIGGPVVALFFVFCMWLCFMLNGCASTTQAINDTDWDNADRFVHSLRAAGFRGWVEFEMGQPAFAMEQRFGLDLGVIVRARVLISPEQDMMCYEIPGDTLPSP